MSEIVHLAGLFNPRIKELINPIIQDIPWESEAAKSVIESGINLGTASEGVIISTLGALLPQDDLSNFVELVQQFREIDDPNEVTKVVENTFQWFLERKVTDIVRNHVDDVPLMVEKMRDLPRTLVSSIKICNMGDLDVDTVIEEDIGGIDGIFKSSFNLVTEASAFRGYIPGQVIQWVSRPGGGKSAAMLQEALYFMSQGKRGLWIALGDLFRFDFLTRSISVLTGIKYSKVVAEYKKHYTDDIREVMSGLDLITMPSRTLSGEDILEFVENASKRYDFVVVDYDSNVKSQESDNMYETGGKLYDILTAVARPLSQPARLVFVACQPKIQYWDDEEIGIESAGESARKQQNIDMMITLGLNSKSDHHCGIMQIAKCRRGKDGIKVPWRMSESGNIEEIGRDVYTRLRSYGGKK